MKNVLISPYIRNAYFYSPSTSFELIPFKKPMEYTEAEKLAVGDELFNPPFKSSVVFPNLLSNLCHTTLSYYPLHRQRQTVSTEQILTTTNTYPKATQAYQTAPTLTCWLGAHSTVFGINHPEIDHISILTKSSDLRVYDDMNSDVHMNSYLNTVCNLSVRYKPFDIQSFCYHKYKPYVVNDHTIRNPIFPLSSQPPSYPFIDIQLTTPLKISNNDITFIGDCIKQDVIAQLKVVYKDKDTDNTSFPIDVTSAFNELVITYRVSVSSASSLSEHNLVAITDCFVELNSLLTNAETLPTLHAFYNNRAEDYTNLLLQSIVYNHEVKKISSDVEHLQRIEVKSKQFETSLAPFVEFISHIRQIGLGLVELYDTLSPTYNKYVHNFKEIVKNQAASPSTTSTTIDQVSITNVINVLKDVSKLPHASTYVQDVRNFLYKLQHVLSSQIGLSFPDIKKETWSVTLMEQALVVGGFTSLSLKDSAPPLPPPSTTSSHLLSIYQKCSMTAFVHAICGPSPLSFEQFFHIVVSWIVDMLNKKYQYHPEWLTFFTEGATFEKLITTQYANNSAGFINEITASLATIMVTQCVVALAETGVSIVPTDLQIQQQLQDHSFTATKMLRYFVKLHNICLFYQHQQVLDVYFSRNGRKDISSAASVSFAPRQNKGEPDDLYHKRMPCESYSGQPQYISLFTENHNLHIDPSKTQKLRSTHDLCSFSLVYSSSSSSMTNTPYTLRPEVASEYDYFLSELNIRLIESFQLRKNVATASVPPIPFFHFAISQLIDIPWIYTLLVSTHLMQSCVLGLSCYETHKQNHVIWSQVAPPTLEKLLELTMCIFDTFLQDHFAQLIPFNLSNSHVNNTIHEKVCLPVSKNLFLFLHHFALNACGYPSLTRNATSKMSSALIEWFCTGYCSIEHLIRHLVRKVTPGSSKITLNRCFCHNVPHVVEHSKTPPSFDIIIPNEVLVIWNSNLAPTNMITTNNTETTVSSKVVVARQKTKNTNNAKASVDIHPSKSTSSLLSGPIDEQFEQCKQAIINIVQCEKVEEDMVTRLDNEKYKYMEIYYDQLRDYFQKQVPVNPNTANNTQIVKKIGLIPKLKENRRNGPQTLQRALLRNIVRLAIVFSHHLQNS